MSTHCLLCDNQLELVMTWRRLFGIEKSKDICFKCESQLTKITGEICTICGRPLHLLAEDFRSEDICLDCYRWESDERWQGVLKMNRSVYTYSAFMKEVISRFKFRGDVKLAEAFKMDLIQSFFSYYDSSYHIVPIPLSSERLYERGFNQSLVLAEFLPIPITPALSRIHLEKQSKKTRTERLHSENIFSLIPSTNLQGENILIIDDIYTTGTTLRHAAEVLKQANVQSVSSLTLVR
ncbi:ComF family protein [Bacillus timonensis]|nr:ComF family protein [Bacillus timonensis]